MTEPPRATWDPAMPTPKDRMRFTLADTNVAKAKAADADPLELPVDDAVYLGQLAYHGQDERATTIALADALVVKHAQHETKASADGVESAEWGNLLAGWREVASRLRAAITLEAQRRGAGFSTVRPTRGGYPAAEYHAGQRPPWEIER